MPSDARSLVIVHFSQDFAPGKTQLGGYSRVLNLCRDGHAHYIFTISPDVRQIEESTIDNVRIIAIPTDRSARRRVDQARLLTSVARAIVRYLADRDVRPDLFFGHSQLFNFFVLWRARQIGYPDVKIVWEANALWGVAASTSAKQWVANRLNWWLQRRVFRSADALVFQTQSSCDLVAREFALPSKPSIVVTNAVAMPETARETPRPARTASIVACIGLFDELNGIPFLVRHLPEGPPASLRFVFAGTGAHVAQVERFCAAGHGEFVGALPFGEMQRRLATFDFLVIPRIPHVYSDVFIPTKLLEAMAHGVIPICSDVAGMREVVRDGEEGLLFRAGDPDAFRAALVRAAALPEAERDAMRSRARDRIRRDFDWATNHERLGRFYEDVIGDGRRGNP